MGGTKIPYFLDPESGVPHICAHGVRETEVAEVLSRPDEVRKGDEGSRVAIGRTLASRRLRVIYVPDPEPDSVFVVTAYELGGKPLAAFHRRMRRRRR